MKMDAGLFVRYALLFFSPEKRHSIARGLCGAGVLYLPGDILKTVRQQYGYRSMLLAETLLFGWCLAATLLMDLLWPGNRPLKGIAGSLCCLASFGLCCDEPPRAMVKLVFIMLMALSFDSCFLTAVFLLIFERIAQALPGSR